LKVKGDIMMHYITPQVPSYYFDKMSIIGNWYNGYYLIGNCLVLVFG
jgi:hypothetical protein